MKTEHKASRYRLNVTERGLEFSTTRASHLPSFVKYALIATFIWLCGLVAAYPPDAWPIRLLVCAGAVVVTYCALTQLRLLIIGETFLFNTKDGTVRRYGLVVCLTKDIKNVTVKRLSFRGEAIYIYLVLQNRRRITIDSFNSTWGISNETYNEVVDAAKDVANYLGVPRTAEPL